MSGSAPSAHHGIQMRMAPVAPVNPVGWLSSRPTQTTASLLLSKAANQLSRLSLRCQSYRQHLACCRVNDSTAPHDDFQTAIQASRGTGINGLVQFKWITGKGIASLVENGDGSSKVAVEFQQSQGRHGRLKEKRRVGIFR